MTDYEKSLVTNCNSIISKNYLRFLVDSKRLSYKLCHDKKKHNFVTTQKNYEQQYGF